MAGRRRRCLLHAAEAKGSAKKRFQEDSENQDPALATPPPRQAPTSRPPFGAPRWNKNAKEAIKSSAEKRPDNSEKEALLNKYAPPRQLKSTLSEESLLWKGYTWPDFGVLR